MSPLHIVCDFCNEILEELDLEDSWELQKHRQAGRIACDECEKTWEEYEDALRDLEEKNREDFEEARKQLKTRYFGEKKDDQITHETQKKKEKKDGDKPRTYFRTIDSK